MPRIYKERNVNEVVEIYREELLVVSVLNSLMDILNGSESE